MAGYVTETDLRAYSITNPKAVDLIPQASHIIDSYVNFPINDDGFKFPRAKSDYLNIPDDAGSVPQSIKTATMEQIIWMLSEGMQFVRQGGDNTINIALPGFSAQKPENDTPLLAPLAKHHLKKFMHRVGWVN